MKLADNRYPIEELLRRRWSTVAYSTRPVEREKLLSLFEAARWAPSSSNEQPWNFILTTKGSPDYQRLLECLMPGNQEWAVRAPVLMLSVARLHNLRNGAVNRHAFHDLGLAVGCMLVQATSLDLYIHQMGGFYIDKAREAFQIPDTHEPVAAMTVGYLGSTDGLPEHLKEREHTPRIRKDISSFVFSGSWGNAAFQQ